MDPYTAIALGTGFLNFFSGSKNANAQNAAMERLHELEIKKFEHGIKTAYDSWVFADEGVDIAIINDKIRNEHTNNTRVNEWIDRDKMRIFDFNNQVSTYNASLERYDKQLNFNDKAQEIALNDLNRKFNESLTEIGFRNEGLQMKLNLDTRKMLATIQGRRAEISAKSEMATLKGLQTEGKYAARGQVGRSARKNMQALNADTGRTQAALIDALTRDESAFGLNLEEAHRTFNFSQRQLQESLKSATSQYNADLDHVSLKKWESDMAAEAAIAPAPQLAPQLTKPLEVPETIYQRPAHPWGEKDPKTGEFPYLKKIMDMKPVMGAKADTTFGPLMSAINTGLSTYSALKP